MGGNDRGLKTKSSITGAQEPVAQAMFEIFKSNLGRQLPGFPGSQQVQPFTQQQVQQNFQRSVGAPMQNLWQQNFAGLIGPSQTTYAQGRVGQGMSALSSQAARRGEGQAYAEWLRTQPETSGVMDIGQAYLNVPQYGAYVPERADLPAAYAVLGGINALGSYAALSGLNAPPVTPSPWDTPRGQLIQQNPWDTTGGNIWDNAQFAQQFLR